MKVLKNFWFRSVVVFSLAQHVTNGFSHNLNCTELVTRLTFAQLAQRAEQNLGKPDDTPHWIREALPPNVKFVTKPGRDHSPHLIQKEMGDLYALQIEDTFNGIKFTTTASISGAALMDNFLRKQQGRPFSLVSDSARGAYLFIHGGGVNTANYASVSNASHLGKRGIEGSGIDWVAHGSHTTDKVSLRPLDQAEFAIWFMDKYFGPNVPQIVIGHSMGGQIVNIMHNLMRKPVIEKKFPNSRVVGFVSLSTPVDTTGGGNIHQKFNADVEGTPDAHAALTEDDNINMVAQSSLTDLTFLDSLDDRVLNPDGLLPMLAIMGVNDLVCYPPACHKPFEKYIRNRPNTYTIMLGEHGQRLVDHADNAAKADHFIPKYSVEGQKDLPGVGAGMPIVYAEIAQWMERNFLGNPHFDIFSEEAKNLTVSPQINEVDQILALVLPKVDLSTSEANKKINEILSGKTKETDANTAIIMNAIHEVAAINSERAWASNWTRILGLYAKNPVFREFLKHHRIFRKVPADELVMKEFNTYFDGFERFVSEANFYSKPYLNPNYKLPDSPLKIQWNTFFDWVLSSHDKEANPELFEDAIQITKQWGSSDIAGQKFAASLLAHTLNDPRVDEFKLKDMPEGIPVRTKEILQANNADHRWKTFLNWFNHPEERDTYHTKAQELVRFWSKSKNPDHVLAARAIALTMGDEFHNITSMAPSAEVVDKSHYLIRSKRFDNAHEIFNFYRNKPGLSDITSQLETQRKILLGLRDLKLEHLILLHPEIEHLRVQKEALNVELNTYAKLRDPDMIGDLHRLHAQKTQLVRLLGNDSLSTLLKKGADLEDLTKHLPSHDVLSSARSYEEVRALYDTLVEQTWKSQAFESFMGPNLRNFFSNMNELITKTLDAPVNLASKKKSRVEEAKETFVSMWQDNIESFIQFTKLLQGAKEFVDKADLPPKLETLRDGLDQRRNDINSLVYKIDDIRRPFIEKHHAEWTHESRPAYPAELDALIEQYKQKQGAFQQARREYAKEFKNAAIEGHFGPYLKFIYNQFASLEKKIHDLEGHAESPANSIQHSADGDQPLSLTSVEQKMIEITTAIAKIDQEIIARYASVLYRFDSISAIDIMNNANSKPTSDEITLIIRDWNSTWRDVTGGKVIESGGGYN